MEIKNATVGMSAFCSGFGIFIIPKTSTDTTYVMQHMAIIRSMLVSHALSASTRLLRDFIASISFSSFSILDSVFIFCESVFPELSFGTLL